MGSLVFGLERLEIGVFVCKIWDGRGILRKECRCGLCEMLLIICGGRGWRGGWRGGWY